MIVLTVDASPESETAVPIAAALARQFDRILRVLLVLDGPLRHHFDQISRHTGLASDEVIEDYLHTIALKARRHGATRVRVARCHAVEAGAGILDATDDPEVSLIVMATHGRSGLNRRLTGSVTERIIRSSMVPVVVAQAHARPTDEKSSPAT